MPPVLVRPNVRVTAAQRFLSASAPPPSSTRRPRHASARVDEASAPRPARSRLRLLPSTAAEVRQWQLAHGTHARPLR
ncbi:hypothetical protein ACFO1B_09920 [Dactylosporangium siamense]|uniref:Uncharacterized protein n=1 Tax=Dactylosporangium siamense TaxID=685454 RepID=A0A919PV75_9ACTN|nr:hypothetical protein [Dactylosporangium siamense]GIG49010.1 hypothetical protein Dsi01nite_070510 [Dactylosporangium siamense]